MNACSMNAVPSITDMYSRPTVQLDIMDRGTDARNFLLGNVIPLRLGYIGVINRSQEDINGKKSVKDALMHEEAFFRSRPVSE